MTVGILTFHSGLSYGAVLQATSLNSYLREMGFDAKIIERGPYSDKWIFTPCNSIRSVVKNLLVMKNIRPLSKRRKDVAEFIKQHQVCTKPYAGVEDLISDWPKMDAYVTGSDQVWNLDHRFNPTFFLVPANPDQSRLISYAASFGTSSIPDKWKDKVAEALRRFHAISVREESAQRIVETLIGTTPELVCDPVFLHDADYYRQWERPCELPFSTQYILVHSVGVDDNLYRLVDYVKKELRLPVVHLQGGTGLHSPKATDLKIFSAGPAEYLHLVDNAAFVCTNSFHGTAFSLIFRKPFLTSSALAGRNTRIEYLLKLFGETDRTFGSHQSQTLFKKCEAGRWNDIHLRIQAEGKAFLVKALGARL